MRAEARPAVPAAPAGRRARAAPPAEDLGDARGELARERVVHGLDPDLLAHAGHVDLAEDLEHAPDVGRPCR
jgi:hypothetical protein